MPEPESTNTMLQGSFKAVGGGNYALATTAVSPTAPGQIEATSGAISESGFGAGSVIAPAAGATIATHSPPAAAAGYLHEIEITTWFSATAPAAADNFNMAFKYGAGNITIIPAVPGLHVPVKTKFYFNAANGVAFSVVAVGAGTAAVAYNAMIVATRVVS